MCPSWLLRCHDALTRSSFLLRCQAYGNDKGLLGGLKVKNLVTGAVSDVEVNGLFFAIGHKPATDFLEKQVRWLVLLERCKAITIKYSSLIVEQCVSNSYYAQRKILFLC
jgi:hypothetical protein